MKKRFLSISVLLIFTLVIILQTNVFASTHILEEIADKFNKSSSIGSLSEILGDKFIAATNKNNNNILSITITNDKGLSTLNYEKDENILSSTHLDDDNLITAYLLADVIGQVNGYNDGELLNNFNMFTDEISNYTVENEGFEIKENNGYYSVKMDITKKVPLIDSSQFYLKPEDFDIIKNIVEEKTSGNQSGRTSILAYNLIVNEDKNYIYIGEQDEITSSTYKSILSALNVMYGEKTVEYFKSIYPDFLDGITELDGFSIEKEIDIDTDEHPIFTGTKVVLVTIDNQYVKDELLRTEYIGETVKYGDKTIELDFTKNKSFKLGFLDAVSSSDAAFLFKYILEPVFEKSGAELKDDTVYFNIKNEKIVVGDKNNSIFKIVLGEDYLELLPTKTNVEKTTVTAKHEEVKSIEYKEGKTQDYFRYGEYNTIINITYGNEIKKETTTYTVLEGAEQTVNTSNSEDLSFKFDIEFNKFKEDGKVYIDGNLVDPSSYTLKKGSTIITFNGDYVKNLTAGEHTLKVAVADGEVSTTFTIENNVKVESTIENIAKADNVTVNNPKTGDNITIYVLLLAVSVLTMLFICIKSKT